MRRIVSYLKKTHVMLLFGCKIQGSEIIAEDRSMQ